MSYVDYSNNFVLDQFFTYINANQLGSNDKHIVDNFSVEHNWNASTADGTHKANSILGSYINKINFTGSTQTIGYLVEWTPTAGIYQFVHPLGTDQLQLYLYISGAWKLAPVGHNSHFLFCDGSNMKFVNNDGSSVSAVICYQKFN